MDLHRYCSAAEENQVSNPDICAINARRALEYIVRASYQMKNIEIGERTSLLGQPRFWWFGWIAPVIFRTGLRRWRSVFLCPTTGYLTREGKSAFCGRRKLFFVRSSPLRERALDGRVPYEKNTQLPLSVFACFRDPDRIRTCDPQLRRLLLYPAELPDQSFIFSNQVNWFRKRMQR